MATLNRKNLICKVLEVESLGDDDGKVVAHANHRCFVYSSEDCKLS